MFLVFSEESLLLVLLVLSEFPILLLLSWLLLLLVCAYLADSIASNVSLIDFKVAVIVLKVISTYSKFDYLRVLISLRTQWRIYTTF